MIGRFIQQASKGSQGKSKDSCHTPDDLLQQLHEEFLFDFDPCPFAPDNGMLFDGLAVPWGERNWVNPPYSKIGPWVQKAVQELLDHGHGSVFLIPWRSNTDYFYKYIFPYASEVRFIRKVHFPEHPNHFFAPLALIMFGFGHGPPGGSVEGNYTFWSVPLNPPL